MIEKIPDNSSIEKSKQFLILANEKLKNYIRAKKSLDIASKRADLTKALEEMYTQLSQNTLINLYNEVKNDFSDFYSKINHKGDGFHVHLGR